ncbi:hypothetical protein ZWY2020_049436 [Hordeum vulgare]|nr:hypothetical protein ZWY2020_049436 [Hordeum vulgare]
MLYVSRDLKLTTARAGYKDGKAILADAFRRIAASIQLDHAINGSYDGLPVLVGVNVVVRSPDDEVKFGVDESYRCGAKIGGDLGSSSQALDGILGFGQSNSSMLSQLAVAGKVRKVFAHCLDTINGGGIFTIGDVVQPKVSTTPLVPGM